ncbi:MAG: response regulator [Lachnospiraceae bacterium]|nr:response regulator [Lachnospiraceae bacterium]
MLKIFLVEDEYVVREGIKNIIDWKAHGYEFVGEASDGELALPMIQKARPDIVITDIRMPFMDGLQLSRLIKKDFPWIEIIILSGYAEFDYAKEAIEIGVAHYLSKPISSSELITELHKLSKKVEQNKLERQLREKYALEMEENSLKDKTELFKRITEGTFSAGKIIELANDLSIDITAGAYQVFLFKAISMHHEENEYSDSVNKIYEDLQKITNEENALMFDRITEGKAILIKGDSPEDIERSLKRNIDKLLKILSKYDHIKYYGGVGETVNRITHIHESYEKASHAYAHRYMTTASRIFYYSEIINNEAGYVSDKFSIGSVDPGHLDRNRIWEFLKTGTRREVTYYVNEFFTGLGENALSSAMFRQYIATDMYFTISSFMDEYGLDRSNIRPFDLSGGEVSTPEKTVNYVKQQIYTAIKLRDDQAVNKYSDIINRVKSYIEKNYENEDLSLNTIASYVNFSPNHLSMIFSTKTGETLIKYLTDFRMDKAKELLRCTSGRNVDISEAVGYRDPHYFSYLFKKTQGMTPTQYRNLGHSLEE